MVLSLARAWSVGAALVALSAVACTSENARQAAADGGSGDVFEMELFDTTLVLDDAALSSLTHEDPDRTLHFAPAPEALASVDRGSVLLGKPSSVEPAGLLRLVTSVERNADELVVHTMATLPQLAFRKLRIQATRTIDPDPAHLGLKPLASGSAYPGTILDEFVFNGDEDPATTDDQVRLTGKLAAGVAYTFGLSVDWSDVTGSLDDAVACALTFFTSCDPLEILPEITGGFSFEAGAEAELHLAGTSFLDFKKPVVLPTVTFEPIYFGPLAFFPELEVRADIEGDASSEFDVGTSAFAHAQAGLSYSSRHGGSLKPPDVTAPKFEVLSAKPGLGAHARVRVGPRLSIKLYKLLGPFATVYAFADLAADRTKTPCYELTAGLEGDIGLSLAIEEGGLRLGLPPFSKDFDITSAVVDQGTCPLPPGGEPGGPADVLANPKFSPWARTYGDTLLHFPFEDAGAQAEWTEVDPTIDGRWVISGSAMAALVKIDGDGTPLWAKTYELPEAWNDTVSQKAVLPGRVVPTLDAGLLVAAFPYTLLKVDDQGAISWAERIGWPYHEDMLRITGLLARPDGGFLVTGNIADDRAATFEQMDAFVARFDAAGVPVWARRLGSPGLGETARALVRFGDGAMVLGSTWNPTGAFWTGWLLRLDADGGVVWGRTLHASDGTQDVRTFLLTGYEAPDGDFIAAGTADVRSRASTLVVKIKPDGTVGWATVEDVPGSYVGVTLTGIAPLPTSGMVASGRFSLRNASDLWFAGLDSIGRVQWMKRFGRAGGGGPMGTDPGAHNAPGLAVGRDGGVLVAGYTQGLAAGSTTEGLAVIEAYAKDGTLQLSSADATLADAVATAVSVTVDSVAWSPPAVDVDAPVASVNVTAADRAVPVTRLGP